MKTRRPETDGAITTGKERLDAETASRAAVAPSASDLPQSSCFPRADMVDGTDRPESARTAQRIAAAKAAGFTSRDIIDAAKAGQLDELWALVEAA